MPKAERLASSEAAPEIQSDVLLEGTRLLRAAEAQSLPLRLIGGVAVRIRAGGRMHPAFERSYGDLDFVTGKRSSGAAQRFFREAGYEPQVAFNALNSKERLLFMDTANDRQVDVFVGSFSMSHTIPLEGRVELDADSVPLAELLLMKLQVHELNEKDVRDALAIVHGHPVGDADGETVNCARIAELCASDWGLWRTITANLDTCIAHVGRCELGAAAEEELRGRLVALRERIDAQEKSRGWRLRAKVGERKRWYETPEEKG
jgi:hypothetical protein